MSFTDEDLRRLKEWSPIESSIGHIEIKKLIIALLARLEAAELGCESLEDLLHHGMKYPNGAIHEANPDLAKDRLEAWQKACGK